MAAKISAPRRARKSRGVRSIFGQCAAAAAAVGLAAISMNAFGADPATGSIRPLPAPNQAIGTGAHPLTRQPSAALDAKLENLAAHARTVDQLYERADALIRMRVGVEQSRDRRRLLKTVLFATIQRKRSASR